MALRPFWEVRHRLDIETDDDMFVFYAPVVIPKVLVRDSIQTLCAMYQGASKMRQRAQLSVYWPLTEKVIANAAATSEDHISLLPYLPVESLLPHETALIRSNFFTQTWTRTTATFFL